MIIISSSPGLDAAPEEGPAAGADLAAVVAVLPRPLAAHLQPAGCYLVPQLLLGVTPHLADEVVALLLVGLPAPGRGPGA